MHSVLAGLIVGLLVMVVDKFPVFDRLLAPVAATLVSFVAKAAASVVPNFCFYATVLSGIIWLLPGIFSHLNVVTFRSVSDYCCNGIGDEKCGFWIFTYVLCFFDAT